jgi:hypothetical protein
VICRYFRAFRVLFTRGSPTRYDRLLDRWCASTGAVNGSNQLRSPRRSKLLPRKRDVQAHGVSSRGRLHPSTDGLIDGFTSDAVAYAAEERLSDEAFVGFGVRQCSGQGEHCSGRYVELAWA